MKNFNVKRTKTSRYCKMFLEISRENINCILFWILGSDLGGYKSTKWQDKLTILGHLEISMTQSYRRIPLVMPLNRIVQKVDNNCRHLRRIRRWRGWGHTWNSRPPCLQTVNEVRNFPVYINMNTITSLLNFCIVRYIIQSMHRRFELFRIVQLWKYQKGQFPPRFFSNFRQNPMEFLEKYR